MASDSDEQRLTTDERELLEAARQLARAVVAPDASSWELERQLPQAALQQAADRGLTGLLVPRSLGGREASFEATARIAEELGAADLAYAFSLVVHNNAMATLATHGSPEQQAYLPAMQSLDSVAAFLLTEPGTGSDAAAIATSASQDGSGWVLNGTKAWVTNGTRASTLTVYAQTQADMGWRGIACFLVDAGAPGVQREPADELLGGHALGVCGFRFDQCRLGAHALLIPPGEGFKAAMEGIDRARALVAAICCGMLRSSLEEAVGYCQQRRAFGRRLAGFQGLRWKLADVATDLHCARLATYHAVAKLDRGERATIEAAHAKKQATRYALSGVAKCMQTMGARGLRHDAPLARHLAGAKIAQFLDGTTEIQNEVIGRDLFA